MWLHFVKKSPFCPFRKKNSISLIRGTQISLKYVSNGRTRPFGYRLSYQIRSITASFQFGKIKNPCVETESSAELEGIRTTIKKVNKKKHFEILDAILGNSNIREDYQCDLYIVVCDLTSHKVKLTFSEFPRVLPFGC